MNEEASLERPVNQLSHPESLSTNREALRGRICQAARWGGGPGPRGPHGCLSPGAEPQDCPLQGHGDPSAADWLTQVLPAETVQLAVDHISPPQTLTPAWEQSPRKTDPQPGSQTSLRVANTSGQNHDRLTMGRWPEVVQSSDPGPEVRRVWT